MNLSTTISLAKRENDDLWTEASSLKETISMKQMMFGSSLDMQPHSKSVFDDLGFSSVSNMSLN